MLVFSALESALVAAGVHCGVYMGLVLAGWPQVAPVAPGHFGITEHQGALEDETIFDCLAGASPADHELARVASMRPLADEMRRMHISHLTWSGTLPRTS